MGGEWRGNALWGVPSSGSELTSDDRDDGMLKKMGSQKGQRHHSRSRSRSAATATVTAATAATAPFTVATTTEITTTIAAATTIATRITFPTQKSTLQVAIVEPAAVPGFSFTHYRQYRYGFQESIQRPMRAKRWGTHTLTAETGSIQRGITTKKPTTAAPPSPGGPPAAAPAGPRPPGGATPPAAPPAAQPGVGRGGGPAPGAAAPAALPQRRRGRQVPAAPHGPPLPGGRGHVAEALVPAAVRAACMREAHPAAAVLVVPDDIPNESRAWATRTVQVLGFQPSAVFTSESYGDQYAAYIGPNTTHVLVDKCRYNVPCSGTLVRSNPLQYMHMMHPVMRAFYVKRVVVLGAGSTGSSTLARALAAHYDTHCVEEYGREYCNIKWSAAAAAATQSSTTTGDPLLPKRMLVEYSDSWSSREFVHIAQEQSRREDELARTARNGVLICDTDALATCVWHMRYMERRRCARVDHIAQTRRRPDLYLLTSDDIPFVQDGTRDDDNVERHWMQKALIEELTNTGRTWILVRGSHEERMATATSAIDNLLRQLPASKV
ncbi:histidine kinase [Pelomyxa schiedti]|nr:histidine kinase [Pelomyxa schiedti]